MEPERRVVQRIQQAATTARREVGVPRPACQRAQPFGAIRDRNNGDVRRMYQTRGIRCRGILAPQHLPALEDRGPSAEVGGVT